MIANLTPEERQKNLQTAQEARKAKKEVWKANSHNLRQDFLDINHWKDLASKYKVRMPTSIEPTTTSRMRTYIKRCGLTVKQYQEISGDFLWTFLLSLIRIGLFMLLWVMCLKSGTNWRQC